MTDDYLALLPELFIDERGPYFECGGIEIRNPMLSDNGFEFGSRVINSYGFDFVSTGGNCTAWVMVFRYQGREVYMMVTDESGCTAKVKPGKPVSVGVYDSETDDMIADHMIIRDTDEE